VGKLFIYLAWEQAKQPVRTLAMGLQDVTLTAGANYAAALGDVARMMETLKLKHMPESIWNRS